MKFLGFLFKSVLAFLAFGAVASLYLSKNKNEYISIDSNDTDLY